MNSSNTALTYSAAAIGGVLVIATVLTWIINASDASEDVLTSTGINEGDTSKDFSYTNPLQQKAGKKRKTSKSKSSKRKTLKRKYK
jgi:hypothetical protein